jgi:hypothetical protein
MFYVLSVIITGSGLLLGLVLFPQFRSEIVIGVVLPWANAVAGFSYMSRNMFGESKKFAVAALANTGLRLAVMLVAFTIVLVLLDVDEFVFIIALFFSYICNSILETIYLQRLKPKT